MVSASKSRLPERNPEAEPEIERAIAFLVKQMHESGHNPKPVVFHSLRVGLSLFYHNCAPHLVIAGLLHDLVEDSDTTPAEIEERFGAAVARMVDANTFRAAAGDRAQQGRECIQRCVTCGKDAMIVMAADKLDNSYYLNPALDFDFCKFWVAEMRRLVEVTKSPLRDEPVWIDLDRQCEKLETALGEWNAARPSHGLGAIV